MIVLFSLLHNFIKIPIDKYIAIRYINNTTYREAIYRETKGDTMTELNTPLTEAFYYILLALRKPNHGYGITQEVEEVTGGRVVLGAGTLYGALQTLEKRGWIEVYSQDAESRKKKEYVITETGKQAFEKEMQRLEELVKNGKMMGDKDNA